MRLAIEFVRTHALLSMLLIGLLLLAGIVDSVGLSTFMPLLSLVMHPGEVARPDSFEGKVVAVFARMGLSLTLFNALTIIVVCVLLRNVVTFFTSTRIGYLAADTTTNLRMRLLRAVMASGWSYFVHQSPGKLGNSLATEAWRASQAFVLTVRVLALIVEMAVYFVFAVLVSWVATLVVAVVGGVLITVLRPIMRIAKRAGKHQTKWNRALLGTLTDTLQSVKPFKAMGRDGLAEDVLSTETRKLRTALRGETFSNALLDSAQDPLYAVVAAIGLYIAIQVYHIDPSRLLFMFAVLLRLLRQTGKVQKLYQNLVVYESAYWSMRHTIDEAESARETSGGTRLPTLERDVVFDAVRFAYGDDVLLDGLDLRIPAGRLTCLVGSSGAGKTTIVDLVVGLHQPAAGRVLIDGVDLREMERNAWRHAIGYVPQENLLLHDTVLHNVTLGNPQLLEEDAEYALRKAGAWPFVCEMPGGLHAIVGERGTRLSGGERQRIMIARALAHRPKLLILDEATSALDPNTERAVCETLLGLRGELTILAISHQSELMRVADVVYRLDRGQLVEPDKLIAVS